MSEPARYRPQATPALPTSEDHLTKDGVGYDFCHPLMQYDPFSMGQIRRDPRDRQRQRCLAVLQRFLAVEPERLAHGLHGEVLPWKRLQQDELLTDHFPTAVAIRQWARAAPRDRLGIGHTFDLLHRWGYLHSYTVSCDWDSQPFILSATTTGGAAVATVRAQLHKQTPYFAIEGPTGAVIGYVDALAPRRVEQEARVRSLEAERLGTVALARPMPEELDELALFEAELRRGPEQEQEVVAHLIEQSSSTQRFFAGFFDGERRTRVGFVDDQLEKGRVHITVELDLPLDPRLILGAITSFAELARLRKAGWPDRPEDEDEAYFEDIDQALGPRRNR